MTLYETHRGNIVPDRIDETRRPMDADSRGRDINVSAPERAASVGVGLGLVAYGVTRPRTVLGGIMMLDGGALAYRGATGHCPAYGLMGISTHDQDRATPHDYFERGVKVEYAVTIDKTADELYRHWRNFENLPGFMHHLESVNTLDQRRSRWRAKAPAGQHVEWEAEIINEEPGRVIAWRSVEGADVHNTGSVRFLPAPGGRGTEVKVNIEYIPPAGAPGRLIASLFGEDPQRQIVDDLRRFKQLMETGELATVEGQPTGRGRA